MKIKKTSLALSTLLLCPNVSVEATHYIKQGLATAVVATAALTNQKEEKVIRKGGKTFTFHGNGWVSVQDIFGNAPKVYRTNNDNPSFGESIDIMTEGDKSVVCVGLKLQGGCIKCNNNGCYDPNHCKYSAKGYNNNPSEIEYGYNDDEKEFITDKNESFKEWLIKIGLNNKHYEILTNFGGIYHVDTLVNMGEYKIKNVCKELNVAETYQNKLISAVNDIKNDIIPVKPNTENITNNGNTDKSDAFKKWLIKAGLNNKHYEILTNFGWIYHVDTLVNMGEYKIKNVCKELNIAETYQNKLISAVNEIKNDIIPVKPNTENITNNGNTDKSDAFKKWLIKAGLNNKHYEILTNFGGIYHVDTLVYMGEYNIKKLCKELNISEIYQNKLISAVNEINNQINNKIMGIVNKKDLRKEVEASNIPFDVIGYTVKLYSDYGLVEGEPMDGNGTATIIRRKGGLIYLLTCAHNVIKYEWNPFGEDKAYKAKNVSFFFKDKEYVCADYYVHPGYVEGQGIDIALVVSYEGYSIKGLPSTFPEIVYVPDGKYTGYILGFTGEKEKSGKLWGMKGTLEVKKGKVEYRNIDTSCGQSGSAIWALVEGVYKIIGVHNLYDSFFNYNCGDSFTDKVLKWEKECWDRALEGYLKYKGSSSEEKIDEKYFITDQNDSFKEWLIKIGLNSEHHENLNRGGVYKANTLINMDEYNIRKLCQDVDIPYVYQNKLISAVNEINNKIFGDINNKIIQVKPGNIGLYQGIVNKKDLRKEVEASNIPFDVIGYTVKLYSDYGLVEGEPMDGNGTATIIRRKGGLIYLLTCAHNVIKYAWNPFSDDQTYKAKNVSFFFKDKEYVCADYYVHPGYAEGQGIDIALVVSYEGYSIKGLPSTFPEIVYVPDGKYTGYILGFTGEKEKSGKLWGMKGTLEVKKGKVEYRNIDTSCGQSGSAIWALVEGVYKIIGVHNLYNSFFNYNCGDSFTDKILKWEKECWNRALGGYLKCKDSSSEEKIDAKSNNLIQNNIELLFPCIKKIRVRMYIITTYSETSVIAIADKNLSIAVGDLSVMVYNTGEGRLIGRVKNSNSVCSSRFKCSVALYKDDTHHDCYEIVHTDEYTCTANAYYAFDYRFAMGKNYADKVGDSVFKIYKTW